MSFDSRKIGILKFGGTSVGTGSRLIQVAKIVKTVELEFAPIIVVSAMSSGTKSQGTTSMLLEAVNEILKPESTKHLQIVDEIQKSHIAAANDALSSHKEILALLERDIIMECGKLRSFMAAAEIVEEISPKSRDAIVSMGEKLSARVFTAVLQSQVMC
jgi:aspartate kinase